jgi:putative ABC transport system ATP-binding protein
VSEVFVPMKVLLHPHFITGKKEIRKLVLPYFEQFQLSHKLHLLPEELSAGQQQKVAIIRTLVKQPSIILADEPTASIDDETGREILLYLKQLRDEKKVTIIIATHGANSDTFSDRILSMENGYIKNTPSRQ